MTVWGDFMTLYGKGGLEVITAVEDLTIRTVIQPDADSITWLPDPTKHPLDAGQFSILWQKHQRTIERRLAWLTWLTWLIKKGGALLIPLPLLISILINVARGKLEEIFPYLIGLVTSAVLFFLRNQLTRLGTSLGGRFLRGRLEHYRKKYLAGQSTPPDYGMEA